MNTLTNIIAPVIRSMGLTGARIKSVSVAAIIDAPADCPAIIRLVWANNAAPASVPGGVEMTAYKPLEPYIASLPIADENKLDTQALEAAWLLGAWDLSRMEFAPLPADRDPFSPGEGITAQIGSPYIIQDGSGQPELMGLDMDEQKWVREAARRGRLTWAFNPIFSGPEIRQKAWIEKDKTLNADGSRSPRAKPWTPWQPVVISANHQTVIRLGKAPHGNRGRKNQAAR